MARTSVDSCYGNYSRVLLEIDVAADNGLQVVDDLRRGNYRVDREPGLGAMRGFTFDDDLHIVDRSHSAPGTIGNGACRHIGKYMLCEDHVDFRVFKHAI